MSTFETCAIVKGYSTEQLLRTEYPKEQDLSHVRKVDSSCSHYQVYENKETYQKVLVKMSDPEHPENLFGLFEVTITVKDGDKQYSSTIHVLAANALGAGLQAAPNDFACSRDLWNTEGPEYARLPLCKVDGKSITATSRRVPFLIRGWGRETF